MWKSSQVSFNPLDPRGNHSARPLFAVPNVTAHPSTASVPTSYYSMCTIIPCAHYRVKTVCSLNVADSGTALVCFYDTERIQVKSVLTRGCAQAWRLKTLLNAHVMPVAYNITSSQKWPMVLVAWNKVCLIWFDLINCYVSSGTLNPTIPYYTIIQNNWVKQFAWLSFLQI